ncbi:MAG: CpsB/CapC family capsule biosynthesis tyrosine phosphatase [Wenzhouxiangella sp.]|jgi:protein-tyrosine phosphatase|nr:CpsB/CapC family capsule biosynthesis tyrosine phosphatase [Wenzhouxiangella sp.]
MSNTARFPWGMVDIHGHLLPGIDDGSKNLEMSLAMARQAVADGISVSLLTPHHRNGVYENAADFIRERTAALRAALKEAEIELEVLPGAECHLVPELPRELRAGTAMTVADRKRAVLVELPVHSVPVGATTILENILALDLQPVIVHPERNSELARNADRLADWVDMGCLAQVTSRSCTGKFGDTALKASEEMVTRGLVHFLASDAHRDRRRIPEMSPGRERITQWIGKEGARLLTEDFPRALVMGREVDPAQLYDVLPKRKQRKGLLSRLLGRG